MLKSMIVSSIAISTTLGSGSNFVYPEDTVEDSWAKDTVLGEGEPNYCGNDHKYQSPIDIQTSSLLICPTTSNTLDWQLQNTIHKFTVENSGHNLRMVPVCCGVKDNSDSGDDDDSDDHDDSNDGPEFENVQSGSNFGVLTDIFDRKYCLDSFHIHWGQTDTTGSEHRINGQQSVMEMHFVHYDCNSYTSVSKAIEKEIDISDESDADPTLAVVSVMFKIGDENPFIQKIVDQVTNLKDAHSKIEITSSDLSMSEVVPNPLGDYYYYKGSLTTPPCTPVGMLSFLFYI